MSGDAWAWFKVWVLRMRVALFPPMPAETQEFVDLRERLASGDHGDNHDQMARLLLETHDGLWRTKRLLRHSNVENRVLYLVAIALAVWAGIIAHDLSVLQHQQASVQRQQIAGRKVTLGVTCNVLGAIAESGKVTISTPTGGPDHPKLEQGLQKLGLPPFEVRQKQAEANGKSYVDGIADRVQKETGVTNLVRDNGTINCDRLRALARLEPRP